MSNVAIMTFERVRKEFGKMQMTPEIDVKEVVGDEVFKKKADATHSLCTNRVFSYL